jgi:hypothetical protein
MEAPSPIESTVRVPGRTSSTECAARSKLTLPPSQSRERPPHGAERVERYGECAEGRRAGRKSLVVTLPSAGTASRPQSYGGYASRLARAGTELRLSRSIELHNICAPPSQCIAQAFVSSRRRAPAHPIDGKFVLATGTRPCRSDARSPLERRWSAKQLSRIISSDHSGAKTIAY